LIYKPLVRGGDPLLELSASGFVGFMDWQEKNSNSPSPIGQVEEKQMQPS